MNIHGELRASAYDARMWWVMVAGCAARFSAERDATAAAAGFVAWVVVFLVCWLVRAWCRARNSAATQEKAGSALAVLGILLFLLRLAGEGLLPALLVFLFAIQAAVFVTATKRLHAWLILGAALAGLMFAAAQSRSPLFLVAAAWFTLAALGLLALDQRIEREGEVLLRRDSAARHNGSFAFALIALCITVPLYLLVPKPTGLRLGGLEARSEHSYEEEPNSESASERSSRQGAAESTSTPTEQISDEPAPRPRNRARTAQPESGDYGGEFSTDDIERDLANANDIVMYVKSSTPAYLRGLVYDRFEQDRWYRDPPASTSLTLRQGNATVPSRFGEDRISQQVEVAANLTTTLWHAPGVRRLRFPGPTVRRFEDDVFIVPQPLVADTVYSIESALTLREGRYLLEEPSPPNLDRYLSTAGVSQQVRTLARSLVVDLADPRGKALALERHLRESYAYTYETIPQQGYTPLDTFLFDTKRGHCEYFASALAILLRTVDVPTRVVTGFSLGEANPMTGYYEVRRLDGHAWVEAYVDGAWMMLEPTPFYPLPRPPAQAQVAAQVDRYLERLTSTSELMNPQSPTAALARLSLNAWRTTESIARTSADWIRSLGWLAPMLIMLSVAVGIGVYISLLVFADAYGNRRVRQMLARSKDADPTSAVLLVADALQASTAPRGSERLPSTSFREYVHELVTGGARLPLEFADAFDEARYGSTVGEPRSASDVASFIRDCLNRDPRPRLRRALQHWRHAAAELFGRTGNR